MDIRPGQHQPTVLVIDDQERNLQVVAATLSGMGYEVMLAASADTALERLAARLPDLILLDIVMPDTDGFALCETLQKSPQTAAIPIIFFSADTNKNVIVRALEAGGVDYITKPFNKAELIARVRTHLELKQARERADNLLEMILPPAIAARLKAGEEHIVDAHEQATVVFADIVGFTDLVAANEPAAIADWLGDVFSHANAIAKSHGVQRVKTIGDAYLGVAVADGDTDAESLALSAARFAVELAAQPGVGLGASPLEWRIGIHSGPLVAGVVGRAQFSFDIWGDTVNIAKRVQESASPGTIRISKETRDQIQRATTDAFETSDRTGLRHSGPDDLFTFRLTPHRRNQDG